MRFSLIDKMTMLEPGKKAEAVKCWSLDNLVFLDHFPGEPIVPGVLLTESVAQTLGLLIEKSYYKEFEDSSEVYPLLSIIQKAKFRELVRPGDKTIIKVKLLSLDYERATGQGSVYVDGKIVMETSLSFLISLRNEMEVNPYLSRMNEIKHIVLRDIE